MGRTLAPPILQRGVDYVACTVPAQQIWNHTSIRSENNVKLWDLIS